MSEYLPPPPHYFHKGRAKWWKKTDAERQKFTDNYNKRIAAKEALIKQRSIEATVNGLSPEAEAKWKELRKGKDPFSTSSPTPVTARSAETSNTEICPTGGNRGEEEAESKQVAIGIYKGYEQRMVSTAPRDCDLDEAVRRRLFMMSVVRNGLWE
jgi:hypothetical protein